MMRLGRRDRAILLPALGAQLIGTTAIFIVPVLLDALVGAGLTAGAAGLVFTLELGIASATTLLAPILIPAHSPRGGAMLGGALTMLGGALSLISPDFAPLVAARMVAGLGAGIVAAEGAMILGRGHDRERLLAMLTMISIVNAAVWLALLPYAIDAFGYRGPYAGLLLIAAAGLVALRRLPSPPPRPLRGGSARGGGWRASWLMLAAALLLTQLGQGAFWGINEALGTAAGLDDHLIGALLSGFTLCLLVGAAGVTWAGARFGRLAPLLALALLNALSMLAVVVMPDPAVYVGANLVQAATNLAALIYQLGLAASIDRSGRLLSVGTGLVTLGNGFGAGLCAGLYANSGAWSVALVLCALNGLALTLYAIIGLRLERPAPTPQILQRRLQ